MSNVESQNEGLPDNVNYFDAAIFLGHTSTARVQHLVRVGTLTKGAKAQTITRESLENYALGRRSPAGEAVWYKVRLTEEQLKNLELLCDPHEHMDYELLKASTDVAGLTFERMHVYDDAAKERRKKRELRSGAVPGLSSGRLVTEPDSPSTIRTLRDMVGEK